MKPKLNTKKQLVCHIGAKARAARLKLGLSQADVAELVGIAAEVYGRLERGQMAPQVSTFRKLCVALGMDTNVALGMGKHAPPEELPGPVLPREKSPGMRRIQRNARHLSAWNQKLLGDMALYMGHAQRARRERRPERTKKKSARRRPGNEHAT